MQLQSIMLYKQSHDKLFEDKIIDENVARYIIIFTKTKHQSAGTDHTGMKTVKFPIKLQRINM